MSDDTDRTPDGGAATGLPPGGRDRLRELLDAVLDEEHRDLEDMAGGAHSSPYHFSRLLSRSTGEPPVAMRRRVMLERAAWQLSQGSSVTDAAFAAGYESVEGFSRAFARAFGHAPSRMVGDPRAGAHWLPAPNGIHFHAPAALWVDSREGGARAGSDVTAQLVHHDVDDTRLLLEVAAKLPEEEYHRRALPGWSVLSWDGPEESLAAVLEHLVWSKEVWVASILGEAHPPRGADDAESLLLRHDYVAPRWLSVVRDVDRRGAWQDRIVDALCEPPESFVIGSVVAHVLTYSAHRRQLARHLLRGSGHDAGRQAGQGDPIEWLRSRNGGTS